MYTVDTQEVPEVLWVYLCSTGYGGTKLKFVTRTTHCSQWTNMRFQKCCEYSCVDLKTIIFGTTEIQWTHEVSESLWMYVLILCTTYCIR